MNVGSYLALAKRASPCFGASALLAADLLL